jgi:cell division septation protein DedD
MARATGKRSKGGGNKLLIGIFAGLVIGVLIAFGIVLYLNKATLPFEAKTGRPENHNGLNTGQEALSLPGKPGDKPTEKPRFEFYKILPGSQEPAPSDNVPPRPAAEGEPETTLAPPSDQFYLQAGAFSKAAEADNLKAKLALMGLSANIAERKTDNGTLYRVRLGPFGNLETMNRVRSRLSDNGVDVAVVRVPK